jgi:hypothetical protein
MDTDAEDSPYGDNASLGGSEADQHQEVQRYEHRDLPAAPTSALALTFNLTGSRGSARCPAR